MRAVSLFCGAGGADLAARDLGLSVVGAFDGGSDQVATARAAGFPAHEVWLPAVGPLPRVAWEALEQRPRLIFGGPPCQPFSSAGKGEGSDDSRDGYPAALHIVRWSRPQRGVFENVRGLLFEKHEEYRESILNELRSMGYYAGIWLLDAADDGVPQRRRRTFIWFALDRDLGAAPVGGFSAERLVESKWVTGDYWREHGLEQGATPMATWEERLLVQVRQDLRQQSMFSPRPAWFGTERWRTVRDALDLSDVWGGGTRGKGLAAWRPEDTTDLPAPTVSGMFGSSGAIWKGHPLKSRAASEPERLDAPSPTVTGQEVKGTRGEHMGKDLGNGVKAGGPDRASDAVWLATGRRRLTPAECATLQDFPPEHPFQGTQTSQYTQIGNAWPRRLALRVLRAVTAPVTVGE